MKNKIYILAIALFVMLVAVSVVAIFKLKSANNGSEILLKLAPVDPRSLIQGDYMALDYELMWEIRYKGDYKFVVVTVDDNRVATFNRLQNDSTQNANELLLRYKRDGNKISLGAEHFFFNTDSVEKYQQAEYGLIKVDDKGRCSLVGVCGNDKRLIE
ncbi:MAG: GDYXXLXY domain-containing protein [Bacteroidales bacterium]|nr:GDYXXLXY domain-containing protein [Bacteroidales bacterium]